MRKKKNENTPLIVDGIIVAAFMISLFGFTFFVLAAFGGTT